MSKIQTFLPYDCSTVANYKAWAMAIGNALSTFGWTQTADSGQVNWSLVSTVGLSASGSDPNLLNGYSLSAWSGGTAYAVPATGSTGSNGVVTSGGLTYTCVSPTQYTGLTNVVLNATSSTASTGVTVSGISVTFAAAVAGASTNSLVGQVFTASGGSVQANNVAYAICTSNTNAAVTLQFAGGLAQASGTYPTLTSSNANFSVGYASGGSSETNWAQNYLAGQSVITAGFTGNTNADGTFTVLASCYVSSGTTYVGMAYNSAPSTGSGYSATLTMNTAPASDLFVYNTNGHWLPYNYEVWQSNDSLSSTNPIVIRFLYLSDVSYRPLIYFQVGSASSGTGYIVGPNVTNGGEEISTRANGSPGGNTLYECDFSQYQGSFGMLLWRNLPTANGSVFLAIDRAKDNSGNDLDTYEQVLLGITEFPCSQVIFKPSIGTTMPLCGYPGTQGTNFCGNWPVIGFDSTPAGTASAGTTAWNNHVATIPIFPVVGYLANPCLQAVVMAVIDVSSGALLEVILYGAAHIYLFGYLNDLDYVNSYSAAVGLRWD